MTHYPISSERVVSALQARIAESRAELAALEAVQINTSHKTLTNRAISGDGARIGDYIGIGKALYVNYTVTRPDGGRSYKSTDITAYTYHDENGDELGTVGIMRISRTMSPAELRAELDKVIDARRASLDKIELDLAHVDQITAQYNALHTELNALLDGLSWATRSALEGR